MNWRMHDKDLAEDEVLPQYVGDNPDGSCAVECGGCGAQSTSNNPQCGTCLKFFVYRPWWEW